jgi:hypothetical protein
MARSLLQRLLLVVLFASLAVPALGKGRPARIVKETVDLAVGEPMRVAFDGSLDTCKRWNCFLWVKDVKEGESEVMVELTGAGEWIAWESAAKEDDKGEGDDDDSADDDDDSASGDDDDSADTWMELPLLSVEERRVKAYESAKKEFTIEKQRGKLTADGKYLVVPGDLLPTESFDLEANGFWGARLGELEIGTGTKTGLVHVKR